MFLVLFSAAIDQDKGAEGVTEFEKDARGCERYGYICFGHGELRKILLKGLELALSLVEVRALQISCAGVAADVGS